MKAARLSAHFLVSRSSTQGTPQPDIYEALQAEGPPEKYFA